MSKCCSYRPKRRALGKGLDSLLPRVPISRFRRRCRGRQAPRDSLIRSTATHSRHVPRSMRSSWPSWPLDHIERRCAAGAGAPARQRPLPVDCRERAGGPRSLPARRRFRPSCARSSDEQAMEITLSRTAARRPESDGTGPRLRPPLPRVPHDPGADGCAYGKDRASVQIFCACCACLLGTGSRRGKASSASATPALIGL